MPKSVRPRGAAFHNNATPRPITGGQPYSLHKRTKKTKHPSQLNIVSTETELNWKAPVAFSATSPRGRPRSCGRPPLRGKPLSASPSLPPPPSQGKPQPVTPSKSKQQSVPPKKVKHQKTASTDSIDDNIEFIPGAQRSVYWCQEAGQRVRLRFQGNSILRIVHTDDGEIYEGRHDSECEVLIHGMCPFHIIAKQLPDGQTFCGGNVKHMHGLKGKGAPELALLDTLDTAFVTHPMPMDAIIRFAELREKALLVYEDPVYRKTYPGQYAQIEDRVPQLVRLDAAPRFDYFINPVCYRILQQRIHRSIWQLDSTSQYSLEYWGDDIGEENVLLYNTGLRVPWATASQFRAPTECYKIAIAFWSPFQKRMWQHFLDSDTRPCYLDAAYRCDRDGFQIWTLFFEYHNITVPVSYLVSTSITVSLVRSWLEALTVSLDSLPTNKTIYVNSTELVGELIHVFPGWRVCYAKYYIIEEFRSLVARPGRSADVQWDAQVVNAVRNIDIDLYSAMKVAAKPGTMLFGLVEYLLDRKEKWLPKADHDLGLFNHSGVAVSRWRYLLWMTMLSRPNNMRVDAVVQYLHRQLTPGVEAVVNDQDSGLRTVQYKSMDAMEQGSRLLKKSLADARILPLAENLVCVSDGRELSSKAIVDLKHKVCFCAQFAEHKVCEHLVFCSSDDVHQPELVRLMESIPYA